MMRNLADQVVVQDYPAGVSIGEHIHAEVFGPNVVSLSLLITTRWVAAPSD